MSNKGNGKKSMIQTLGIEVRSVPKIFPVVGKVKEV